MPSTLFVAPPTAIEAEAEAEAAFQQSVLRNECDIAICDAAFRSADEWHATRRQYESRLDARRTLDEVVPTLKAKADAAEKAVGVETDCGDWVTLGQLREQIAKINPTLATATPEGLAKGLLLLAAAPLSRQAVAMNARMAARDTESTALQLLHRTAVAVPDGESNQIRSRVRELEAQIAWQERELHAENFIKQARERLSQARRDAQAITTQSEAAANRAETQAAKLDLDKLSSLSRRKREIENAIKRDNAELARLRIALGIAEQQQRDAMLIPENIAWPD